MLRRGARDFQRIEVQGTGARAKGLTFFLKIMRSQDFGRNRFRVMV